MQTHYHVNATALSLIGWAQLGPLWQPACGSGLARGRLAPDSVPGVWL